MPNLAQPSEPNHLEHKETAMKLRVAVAGASGYVGGELIGLIQQHPNLELVTVTANSNVGQSLGSIHEIDGKFAELVFQETSKEVLADHDVVFLALPHTKSAEVAKWLSDETLVLDCGADFRLESAEDFEKFYKSPHAGTWSYGMPELLVSKDVKLREQLAGAKRIAVPGCNATAVTLAFAPLLASGVIEPKGLVSTLSVGTSGAGKHSEVNDVNKPALSSAYAYQVGGIHRHIPEIAQNLNRVSSSEITLTFTPVLVPMFRGILAVNTAELVAGKTLSDVRSAFESAYSSEHNIQILADGEYPNTADVEHKNLAVIGFGIDEATNRVVVISAIDNLVKGTAGAAIQSLNIACGFKEDTGLAND
jgi:N-acetyl-gamma-glutamyl-phosphate reductase